MLLRRWRMIVAVTLGVTAAAVAVSLVLPVWYRAYALIIPPQQESGLMGAMLGDMGGLSSLAGDLVGGRSTSDLYLAMLRSETVKDELIERFKLADVYGTVYRLDTYRAIDDRSSISAGKKDGVITIAVEDRSPERAAALANGFVDALRALTVRLNVAGAGTSRGFLGVQLDQARQKLSEAEEGLKAFQSRNKAIDVPEQAKASIAAVAELQAQLATQEVQLASLRQRFTDEAPEVRSLMTSIESLRRQIAQLEGRGTGAIPPVGSVPQLGQEYVRLMREFKIQETLVELLTKQYEMAKLTESKDSSSMQVLQTARAPDKKSRPKRAQIVLVAGVLAFFFAALGALVQDFFRRMSPAERARWARLAEQGRNRASG